MRGKLVFLALAFLLLASAIPVTAQEEAISLSWDTNSQFVEAGETATYNIIVRSRIADTQSVHMDADNVPSGWSATFSDIDFSIAGYENKTILFYVTISTGAEDATSNITVTATTGRGIASQTTFTTTSKAPKECTWKVTGVGDGIGNPYTTEAGVATAITARAHGSATDTFNTGFVVVEARDGISGDVTATWNNYWTISTAPAQVSGSLAGEEFIVTVTPAPDLDLNHWIKIDATINDGSVYTTTTSRWVKVTALSGDLNVDVTKLATPVFSSEIDVGGAPAEGRFTVSIPAGSASASVTLKLWATSANFGDKTKWNIKLYDLDSATPTVPIIDDNANFNPGIGLGTMAPGDVRTFKLEVYAQSGLGGGYNIGVVCEARITVRDFDREEFGSDSEPGVLPENFIEEIYPGGWYGLGATIIVLAFVSGVLVMRKRTKKKEEYEE